jgi:two-component system chemotaxis response regulator CheY
MLSVLVIDNENIDKSSLYEILKNFKKLTLTKANTIDESLELFDKRYFELMFLDCSIESVEKLKNFKTKNPNIIIISIYDEFDQELKDAIYKLGINDCINNTTDKEILTQRISNYLDLARLNKEQLLHSDAINLFHKEISRHFLTFKLNSSQSKLEFWDYFSSSYFQRYAGIDESIDLLYAFTSWMFLNKRECEVIKETDKENMYLTLQPIDYMSDKVVKGIINKYAKNTNHKITDHKLSLKLTNLPQIPKLKNTSKLDEETKDILSKTHFDKITAAEYVESTAIELINKIEDLSELEDKIDEAILNFESDPNTDTTKLLSQEFMEYVTAVDMLVDFQHLAYALKTLADAIKNIKQEQMQEKEVKKFTTLILLLLNDLSTWRENIFIKQEANDIHYLDSSLLSSCLQIEAIFEKEKIEEDEDDFELF